MTALIDESDGDDDLARLFIEYEHHELWDAEARIAGLIAAVRAEERAIVLRGLPLGQAKGDTFCVGDIVRYQGHSARVEALEDNAAIVTVLDGRDGPPIRVIFECLAPSQPAISAKVQSKPWATCSVCRRREESSARNDAYPDQPGPWGWQWVDGGTRLVCERCLAAPPTSEGTFKVKSDAEALRDVMDANIDFDSELAYLRGLGPEPRAEGKSTVVVCLGEFSAHHFDSYQPDVCVRCHFKRTAGANDTSEPKSIIGQVPVIPNEHAGAEGTLDPDEVVDRIVAENMPKATTKQKLEPRSANPTDAVWAERFGARYNLTKGARIDLLARLDEARMAEQAGNPYPGDEARVRKWFDEEDGGTYLEGVARLVGVFAEVRADERLRMAEGKDARPDRVVEILGHLEWFRRGDGRWDVAMRSMTYDMADELHGLLWGEPATPHRKDGATLDEALTALHAIYGLRGRPEDLERARGAAQRVVDMLSGEEHEGDAAIRRAAERLRAEGNSGRTLVLSDGTTVTLSVGAADAASRAYPMRTV